MQNNKNVTNESPFVLNEKSLVTIPLDDVSQVYNIYNNYLENIGKYKKEKCDKYVKKRRINFENNFIGSPEEFRIAEATLNSEIEEFISKVKWESYPKAEEAMMSSIRTFFCKEYKKYGFNEQVFDIIYDKAREDIRAWGEIQVMSLFDSLIEFLLKIEKAKTANIKE